MSSNESSAKPEACNPLLVEVTRGSFVESRHRGAFAVVEASGRLLAGAGDLERPVYPRSAVKPLQALAFLESGAAEAFACSDREVALACASHEGEPQHVAAVAAWLARLGLSAADLECGAHWPFDETAKLALAARGKTPDATYNNCSGKHTAFLAMARHLGIPLSGYIAAEHPVQQRVKAVLAEMTGANLEEAPCGIDGCGIPVLGIPLPKLAYAMARLAAPQGLPEARRQAADRVRRAMTAEPEMVGGSSRFCSKVIAATGGRALVKTGAEGVFCASLTDQRLGVALKIDDGAGRAAEVLMLALLERLEVLDEDARRALQAFLRPQVANRTGLVVGEVRAAPLPL